MELLQFVQAIRRRKWVLIQTLLFFVVAAAAITMTLPKRYHATSKVMVESSDTTSSILGELGLEEIGMSLSSGSDDMLNKVALATMRPVLSEVVWRLQLRRDDGRLLEPEQLIVGGLSDDLMAKPKVAVEQAPGTEILLITAKSDNPELSRLMADTMVNVFIKQSEDRARSDTREARTFISDQLTHVQTELDTVLGNIAEVQQTEQVLDLEAEVKAAVSRLSELMLGLEQSLATIEGLRAELAQARDNMSREDVNLVSPTSIQQNATIRVLREELSTLRQKRSAEMLEKTEKHPDVLLLTNQVEATKGELELALKEQHELSPTIADLKSKLASEVERSQELKSAIDRTTADFSVYPDKMRKLSQLQLAAQATESLFESLQAQSFEIAIAEALTLSDLQFVEPAQRPQRHASPKLLVNGVASIVVGLFLGLSLVLALEYIDDSIKEPNDLRDTWDLPHLGVVPRFGRRDEVRVINEMAPHEPVAEAFRTLRNSIVYATIDRAPRYLAVSSSIPGEGKSTVTMNLAISIARTGKRVIIVDCDFRRPNQHRFFAETSNHVGVTSVLLGKVGLEDAMQATPVDTLRLMAAGPVPTDPGRLAESLKMRQVLMDVAKMCDLVIVDTPPILVVNDAVVVSRHVDYLILVAEADRTSRKILVDTRNRLEDAGVEPLGLVLNKLETRSTSYYGAYYRYYRSHYALNADGSRPTEEGISPIDGEIDVTAEEPKPTSGDTTVA